MKRLLLLALGFASFFCHSAIADIHINGYTDASNDRFTDSGSFILNRHSLSGVGQGESGNWGTLISPNVVITAAHTAPGVGSRMSFYLTNNPKSGPVVRKVTNVVKRIGNTDLCVAELDEQVDGATYYELTDEFLFGSPGGVNNLVNAGSLQGVNAYMLGRSPRSNDPWRDQAVGRNLISGYWENYGRLTDQDTLFLDYNVAPSLNVVRFESHLQPGDSGAPLFIERNGKLILIGVNSFVVLNGAGEVASSGVAYVGNKAHLIMNYTLPNAVPEPTAGLLLGSLLGLGLSLRRNRSG